MWTSLKYFMTGIVGNSVKSIFLWGNNFLIKIFSFLSYKDIKGETLQKEVDITKWAKQFFYNNSRSWVSCDQISGSEIHENWNMRTAIT